MVILEGFHIVTPTEDPTVLYKYTGNNNIPSVQDGIVIADSDGNQFVWIPVGTINNKKNDENGEKTTTITLGRYTFESGIPSTPITDGTIIASYYTEDTTSTHKEDTNTIAKDIDGFKSSAKKNHGYYLARYEAGYKDGNKPLSKPSIGTPQKEDKEYPTEKGQLWNNITQPNAATAAQAMYSGNTNFTSDLVNSYAWDTAIVFIQKYSGDTDYSIENGQTFSSSIRNTGVTDNEDKVCNIYDMASNCREWTTETYNVPTEPCVPRGGVYYNDRYTPYGRGFCHTYDCYSGYSFRVSLYVL